MNKTITFLSVAGIATIAAFALSTGLHTSASEVDTTGAANQSASESMQGRGFGKGYGGFDAVKTAVEAKDFSAFQTAVKDTPLATQITTAEQFEKFVQMHTLREEGKTEEAKALANELGLPEMKMKGKGMKAMHGDPAKMQAVKTAITANDFTAFQTAIADDANSPLAGIATAEEFAKLVQMHSLLAEAKTIGEELGLPGPHRAEKMGKGGKGGKGFGKMMR